MSMPHSTWISPYPAHSLRSSTIGESAMGSVPLRVLLAEIGVDHGGILDDVARLPVGNHLSVVQHDDAGTDVEHDLHQVLDHHDGDTVRRQLMNQFGCPLHLRA